MRNGFSSSNTCEVTAQILDEAAAKEAVLQLGNENARASIRAVSPEKLLPGFMRLSGSICRHLKLPEDYGNLAISYKDGQNIKLGPVVGVLSTRTQGSGFPRGKKARLFKELVVRARDKGILVYMFYADNVNYKQHYIQGYTINRSGKWIYRVFPLADIVYNRIEYRSEENKPSLKDLLRWLNGNGVYVFNSRFLNKWEVYQAIKNDPAGSHFIPETTLMNFENLSKQLESYPEVFLKPSNSSRGQGIIKIIRQGDGSLLFAKADSRPVKWMRAANLRLLIKRIRENIGNKQYLIQQGINLARFEGKVFDLRTQVQKDGRGEWVTTGVAVRVAGKERFVTHIPNGGSAASFSDTMEKAFNKQTEVIRGVYKQLNTICHSIPEVLEKELGLNLAILSLDIGIDISGRLWVLEVNSKPASFDEDDIRSRHYSLLTDYFIFANKKKLKD